MLMREGRLLQPREKGRVKIAAHCRHVQALGCLLQLIV